MPYLLPIPRPLIWLFAVVAVAVVALLIAAAFADSADAAERVTGFTRILGVRRPV